MMRECAQTTFSCCMNRFLSRLPKPSLIAFIALFLLALTATAGSLTPSASPASTFRTLSEIYDAIASDSFDSSSITASSSGSLIQHLKYIEENIFVLSSNSLDFDEFVDAMTLDANTTIASGGFSFSVLGNVGIGTTTPTTTLDVSGSASVSGNFELGGYASISSDLFVQGNVGIGNITPNEKLDVTGNILASTSGNVDFILKSTSAVGDEGTFTIRSAGASDELQILANTQKMVSIASTAFYNTTSTASPTGVVVMKVGATTRGGIIFGPTNTNPANIHSRSDGSYPGLNIESNGSLQLWVNGASNTDVLAAIFLEDDTVSGLGKVEGLYTIQGRDFRELRLRGGDANGPTDGVNIQTAIDTSENYLDRFVVQAFSQSPIIYLTNFSNFGIGDTSPDARTEIVASGSGDILNISSTVDADGDLLTVASTGNIGIGTTAPQNLLHISGGSGNQLRLDSAAGENAVIELYVNAVRKWEIASDVSGAGEPDALDIRGEDGDSLFTFMQSGRVGIGTTTPTTTLDVSGSASVSGNFELGGTVSSHLIPTAHNTYDLGSDAVRWRDVYVSSGSLHIGNSSGNESAFSHDPATGELNIEAAGEAILFNSHIKMDSTFNINFIDDPEDPTGASATITRETLEFNQSSGTMLKLTSDGFLGIGVTEDPTNHLEVAGTASISGTVIMSGLSGVDGSEDYLCLDQTTKEVYFGASCTPSSIRFKQNVQDLPHGLDWVSQLRPVTFDWKESGEPSLGFIAEEVASVSPLLALYQDNQIWSVNYQVMTAVLAKSIQELNDRIDAQQGTLFLTGENPDTNSLFASIVALFKELLGIEFERGVVQTLKGVFQQELCVGERCITAEQFNQLLDNAGIAPTSSSSASPEPNQSSGTPTSLTVIKKVIGGQQTATDFSFTIVGPNGSYSYPFGDDDNNDDDLGGIQRTSVQAGTYTITEVDSQGYEVNYQVGNETPNSTGCVVDATDGGSVTCTITNTYDTEVLYGCTDSNALNYDKSAEKDNNTCKYSTDTIPPTISLNGDAAITLTEGDSYTDLGATAQDDVDGSLPDDAIQVIDSVNTAIPGSYTVTYSVSDAAGNTATVTRTVTVKPASGT